MKPNRRQFLGASIASASALSFLPRAQAQDGRGHDVRACGAQPQFARAGLRRPGGRQLGDHADLRHPGAPGGRHLRGHAGGVHAVAGRELDLLADAATWTFQLRKGVQFHKGYGEMTSDDVMFTFERLLDPKKPVDRQPLYAGNIADVTAERSAHRHLHAEAARPAVLRHASSTPVAAHRLARRRSSRTGDKHRHESDRHRRLRVRPHRPGQGHVPEGLRRALGGPAGHVRSCAFSYILDTTARTLALLSGHVDMIEGVRAPGWIASMQQRRHDAAVRHDRAGQRSTRCTST